MRPWHVGIATAFVAVMVLFGLARAQTGPDCSTGPCLYLAMVLNPAVPTASPTTELPTATPTKEPSPTTEPTPTKQPSPTVGPTSTPTLPPPTYNECRADPNPAAAPNYPVRIIAINKVAETVTLRNVTSSDTIDLTNWKMCSITGNQRHPISGTLAPGESRTFPGPAGNIWNNTSSDPGALYNSQGQLVSYFPD
jgi:hypothetical protein